MCMCVGGCAHSSAVSVLVPSGRSCFQSKPFPADADASVNSTSDFLSSGKGDRIPGAGQLYALQRFYWAGHFHGNQNMENDTHLLPPLCEALTQDGGMGWVGVATRDWHDDAWWGNLTGNPMKRWRWQAFSSTHSIYSAWHLVHHCNRSTRSIVQYCYGYLELLC